MLPESKSKSTMRMKIKARFNPIRSTAMPAPRLAMNIIKIEIHDSMGATGAPLADLSTKSDCKGVSNPEVQSPYTMRAASAESTREIIKDTCELVEYLKVERKLLCSKEKVKRQNGKVKSNAIWLITTQKNLTALSLLLLPSYFLPSC